MIIDCGARYLSVDACDYPGAERLWSGNAPRLLDRGGALQAGPPAAARV